MLCICGLVPLHFLCTQLRPLTTSSISMNLSRGVTLPSNTCSAESHTTIAVHDITTGRYRRVISVPQGCHTLQRCSQASKHGPVNVART